MSKVTIEQVNAMVVAGFEYGVNGYPLLWSDNGRLTIVAEEGEKLFVWEFDTEGNSTCRSFRKTGERHSNIPTKS